MVNATHTRYEKEVTRLTFEGKVQVITVPFDVTDVPNEEWARLQDVSTEEREKTRNKLEQKLEGVVVPYGRYPYNLKDNGLV